MPIVGTNCTYEHIGVLICEAFTGLDPMLTPFLLDIFV